MRRVVVVLTVHLNDDVFLSVHSATSRHRLLRLCSYALM